MSGQDKLNTYELFIEDMLRVFKERFNELDVKYDSLTEYEGGRWMAYKEILDIIKTREDQISEMLTEE